MEQITEERLAGLLAAEAERDALWDRLPRWLPLAEQDPPECQPVLVWSRFGAAAVRLDFLSNGDWFSGGTGTHWMSLPDPPAE